MQKIRIGVFFAYIGVIILAFGGNVYATDIEVVPQEDSMSDTQIHVVSQEGTGDYLSIQEAVDAAKSGDIVRIMPGIYHESVKIDGKAITLEGTQRDQCILQYDGSSYENPPLDMSSGTVRDLTICSLKNKEQEQEMGQSYAVHIDKAQYDCKTTLFHNCRVISETSACFGIGLWGEQHIYIEDCEIISKSYTPNVYLHDVGFQPYGGKAYFTMRRCSLQRESYGYVLLAHAILPANTVYMTFQDIKDIYLYDAGNSKICIDNKFEGEEIGWCGLNNMFLMEESTGNTIEEMNYSIVNDTWELADEL